MSVVDLLLNLGAAKVGSSPYAARIELAEHQILSFSIPSSAGTEELTSLISAFAHGPARRLIAVQLNLKTDGGVELTFKTTSVVGFGAIKITGELIFLKVRPKVKTERLLELALAAERLPAWNNSTPLGNDDVSAMVEWTARAFVDAMERLAGPSGFRSTHVLSKEVLRNRVRGKMLISDFMLSVARGRPDRIACEYSRLSEDHLHNRILRWGIHLAYALANELALHDLTSRLKRLELALHQVALIAPSTRDLARLNHLPPNLRHYRSALDIAALLIRDLHLHGQIGENPGASIALDMNDLYEEAFWRIFKQSEPEAQRKPNWPLALTEVHSPAVRKSLRCEPDIYISEREDRPAIIIDTKWKEAHRLSASLPLGFEHSLVSPRTADVYQVTTYALALLERSGGTSALAVLAYPCLGRPPVMSHEFRLGSIEIRVLFVGWNLSMPLQEGIRMLRADLAAASSGPVKAAA